MRLDGTSLIADHFRPGHVCLISHYHGDHLGGRDRIDDTVRIVCSEITARLLTAIDRVPAAAITVVGEHEETKIDTGRSVVTVRALPANHCPGAVMFHLDVGGRRILYTGDFRLNDEIRETCRPLAGVDVLYVDSTYDQPRYRFPPMEESIAEVVRLAREAADASEICLGVYTIGKSNVLEAIVEEFGVPVYASAPIYRAYRAMGMDRLVTSDRDATRLRAYARNYFESYFKRTRRYHADDVVVIIPTGWAVDEGERDPKYHYVPYSEHCDYAELQEFKEIVGARTVVPI